MARSQQHAQAAFETYDRAARGHSVAPPFPLLSPFLLDAKALFRLASEEILPRTFLPFEALGFPACGALVEARRFRSGAVALTGGAQRVESIHEQPGADAAARCQRHPADHASPWRRRDQPRIRCTPATACELLDRLDEPRGRGYAEPLRPDERRDE